MKEDDFIKEKKRGFTLLEILIVVIIVGILGSLALPRFIGAVEKARAAEAFANLGSLRNSLNRYYLERQSFTTNFNLLDMGDPNSISSDAQGGNRYFSYSVVATDSAALTFTIRASRTSGRNAGEYINMNELGQLDDNNWLP